MIVRTCEGCEALLYGVRPCPRCRPQLRRGAVTEDPGRFRPLTVLLAGTAALVAFGLLEGALWTASPPVRWAGVGVGLFSVVASARLAAGERDRRRS